MVLAEVLVTATSLLDEINIRHRQYLTSLLDTTRFKQEYHCPPLIEMDIAKEFTHKYTRLLVTLHNNLNLDDLVNAVEDFDETEIESYLDHRWILRHLLDLFLGRIEDFYENLTSTLDGQTIITSILTSATYAGYNKVKKYLTKVVRDKFYQDLNFDLNTKPVEPRLALRYYYNLHYATWQRWRGVTQSLPVLQSLTIIKDPEILSQFYLQHVTCHETVITTSTKSRRKKRKKNDKRH